MVVDHMGSYRQARKAWWSERKIFFVETYIDAAMHAHRESLVSRRGLREASIALHPSDGMPLTAA